MGIDTQRQTAAVELKEQWENVEKGRAERAKLARDQFLVPAPVEDAEPDPRKDVPGKAPTKIACENPESAPGLTAEQLAERMSELEKVQEAFESGHGEKAEGRGATVTKWAQSNEARTAAYQEVKASMENTFAPDTTRRDALIAE